MIILKKASKIYRMGDETIRALDGLSLQIENGEFVALVGPSGSGKSTLMNVIGALDLLIEGSIEVEGTDLTKLSDNGKALYRRKHVGFVFQTFNLQNQLSALENVELPMIFSGISASQRRSRSLEMLKRMGLSDRVGHKPSELSGGQQQRVAIARALVNKPSILLADEPTGNLDSASGEHIMDLLKDLNVKEGVTIVLVTHNEEHAKYARRTLHMRDGNIIKDNGGRKK